MQKGREKGGGKGAEKEGQKKGRAKGGEKGGSNSEQQQLQPQQSFDASLSREYPYLHRRLRSTTNREENLRAGRRIAAKGRPRPSGTQGSSSSSGGYAALPRWASPEERETYLWDCLEIEEGLLQQIAEQEEAERARWRAASAYTDEADRWRQWKKVFREVAVYEPLRAGRQLQAQQQQQGQQQQQQSRPTKSSRKKW